MFDFARLRTLRCSGKTSSKLCLHVLFSFQRTDPAPKDLGHRPRRALTLAWQGPDQPLIGRIQGNLLRLLQLFQAVNPTHQRRREHQSAATYGLLGKPSVLLSDLGARQPGNLGTTNAEGESRYYAPREGLSTRLALSGSGLAFARSARITRARTASHTAGQPSRESQEE